jgi:hypothetical protein
VIAKILNVKMEELFEENWLLNNKALSHCLNVFSTWYQTRSIAFDSLHDGFDGFKIAIEYVTHKRKAERFHSLPSLLVSWKHKKPSFPPGWSLFYVHL